MSHQICIYAHSAVDTIAEIKKYKYNIVAVYAESGTFIQAIHGHKK